MWQSWTTAETAHNRVDFWSDVVVRGIGVLPIFAGMLGLLLLIGALAMTWAREGR